MRDLIKPKHAILYFAGGNRTNIGAGVAILQLQGMDEAPAQTHEVTKVIWEDITPHSCEYHGLLAGLQKALELEVTHIQVWGDSQLVVKQTNRIWQCNLPHLQTLRNDALQMLKRFESKEIKWLSDEKNIKATALCTRAMNKALREAHGIPTPA